MDRVKLVSILEQIKALAEESLLTVRGQAEPRSSDRGEASARARSTPEVDFNKPMRPFMKAYAKGLSGPKKFVILLAWLAKGDLKREVALSEIQKHWDRMTSILEMKFNRFFPSQAKDNDWVESKQKGLYNLRPAWHAVLNIKD